MLPLQKGIGFHHQTQPLSTAQSPDLHYLHYFIMANTVKSYSLIMIHSDAVDWEQALGLILAHGVVLAHNSFL